MIATAIARIWCGHFTNRGRPNTLFAMAISWLDDKVASTANAPNRGDFSGSTVRSMLRCRDGCWKTFTPRCSRCHLCGTCASRWKPTCDSLPRMVAPFGAQPPHLAAPFGAQPRTTPRQPPPTPPQRLYSMRKWSASNGVHCARLCTTAGKCSASGDG